MKLQLLETLSQEACGCVRCDLANTRTNVVFGEGNPESPLMFVGEGPGEQEDATGRPFVGRAGQLLDRALYDNKMLRKHVYICNIIKCRATRIENGRVWNRPPSPEEVDSCKPWLMQQLEIIKPLVIVCVGRPSAELLIHKGFAMTRERGQWFDSPYCRAITAVLHPAYVLRQHGPAFDRDYGLLVSDIGAARRKVVELKREGRPEPVTEPISGDEQPSLLHHPG